MGNSGYRNDGIAIFDGEKIINLDFESDDYGTLPSQFTVLQLTTTGHRYPVNYWHDVFQEGWLGLTHNHYVWFDHRPYIDQCTTNVIYDDQLFPGKYAMYTHFINDDGQPVYKFYYGRQC